MAEHYFDTRDGSLLIGTDAIDPRLEEAGPQAVMPLAEILTARDFPYTSHDFDKQMGRQWSREELIELGSWAVKILQTHEASPQALTKEHFVRLYLLGLGPNIRRQRAFPSLPEMRQATGSPEGFTRGLYDDWTGYDFVRYAARVSADVGRRPRNRDYNAADGPSARIINMRIGSVRELNEMIGYPNIRSWELDDYVSWGVQVMRANPDRPISKALIKELSHLDRGPSEQPIYRYFGDIPSFRHLVEAEYVKQEKHATLKKQELLQKFDAIALNSQLPVNLTNATEDQKIAFVGKYELAKQCLGSRIDRRQQAASLALLPVNQLMRTLRSMNDRLDIAKIETEAVILDVHTIIWPVNDLDQLFRVA